jgi:hypothetical protein
LGILIGVEILPFRMMGCWPLGMRHMSVKKTSHVARGGFVRVDV